MRLLFLLWSLSLFACGQDAPLSHLTQSTIRTTPYTPEEALMSFCRDIEPETDIQESLDRFCTHQKPGTSPAKWAIIQDKCQNGTLREDLLEYTKFLRQEFQTTHRRYAKKIPTALSACLDRVVDFTADLTLDFSQSDQASHHKIFPTPQTAPDCWIAHRIDENGCVDFRVCKDTKQASITKLPLAPKEMIRLQNILGSERVSEGNSLRLCKDSFSSIHKIKDSEGRLKNHNNSIVNHLTYGRYNPRITYGPANCHGAVQHIFNAPMEKWTIPKITYHGPHIKEKCGPEVESLFERTATTKGQVTLQNLPIHSGSVVINMSHEDQLFQKENQCGEVSLQVNDCKILHGQPHIDAHLFANHMELGCWNKTLQQQGLLYQKKAPRLKSNCVLTQRDHSITIFFESNDICYFYESQAPFAPPQINMASCRVLQTKFEHQWCADDPMEFHFKDRTSL